MSHYSNAGMYLPKPEREITDAKLMTLKGSKLLDNLSKDVKNDNSDDVKTKCRLSKIVFGEAMEEYEEGEIEFLDMVEELYKALKVIATTKAIDYKSAEKKEEGMEIASD